MPTVTVIADQICFATGLATTSTERAHVIAAMNYAYAEAVRKSGCRRVAMTAAALTAGVSDYTFGTSPLTDTNIVKMRWLTVTDGSGTNRRLRPKTEREILDLRQSTTGQGNVTHYAIVYPTLMLWPPPGTGSTLNGSTEQSPKTLVESGPAAGEESTPTAFPVDFHTSILFHGGVCKVYELDSSLGNAGHHERKYGEALADLTNWVDDMAGVEGGSVLPDDDYYLGGKSSADGY